MNTDAAELSLVDVLALLESRTLSARELVESCLARISAVDGAVRAFVTLTPECALAAAVQADADRAAGRPVGPLAGVPVAVKDLYLTRGTPTEAGSRVLAGHDPGVDAAAWARLAAAGAGLLGKTTTHEFAYGTASHPSRNPWDLARTPGGSSGGSAAALAARLAPVALGSDTVGSLRIPSAACGVNTLRAAHGRVSAYGVVPLSPSLDVAGPMARRMRDVAVLMPLLAGHDTRDRYSRTEPVPDYAGVPDDLSGVRIGIPTQLLWTEVDPQLATACRQALQLLVARGAELVEMPSPPSTDQVLDGTHSVLEATTGAEALHVHQAWLARREEYTPPVLRRVLAGEGITATEYLEARRLTWQWTQEWRRLFAELRLDAVAHPTIDQPPPVIEPDRSPHGPATRLSAPWSLTGFPALSVPVGLDGRGLPVGLSLAGLPEREGDLLGLGVVIDEEIGFWRQAPALR